jgi:hypothetical protein
MMMMVVMMRTMMMYVVDADDACHQDGLASVHSHLGFFQ